MHTMRSGRRREGLETGTDANKDLLVCFFWAEGGGGLFLSFCRHENLSIPLAGLRTLGSREKLLRVHRRCRRWPSTRWIHDREDDTSQKSSLMIYCFEIFPPLSLILAISPLLLVGHMELRFWRLSSLQVAHELHLKLSRTPIFNIDKYAGWGEGALTEAEQSRQFLSEEAVGNLSAKGVISSVRARAANAIEANSYTIAMAAAKQLQSEMPVHITLLSLSLSLSFSVSFSLPVSFSLSLSLSLSLFRHTTYRTCQCWGQKEGGWSLEVAPPLPSWPPLTSNRARSLQTRRLGDRGRYFR